MTKAVRDLLEAFYNVLYKMLFEAVALFMGERRREGRRGKKGVERGERREMRAGNKLLCIWKHHPGISLMGTLSQPPPPAPTPAHPPLEKL